jgi:hypothetical protein
LSNAPTARTANAIHNGMRITTVGRSLGRTRSPSQLGPDLDPSQIVLGLARQSYGLPATESPDHHHLPT